MPAPEKTLPLAVDAKAVPARAKPSNYPEPFYSRVAGREKRPLGDVFGLKNFGVNLTVMRPGAESSVLHRHTRQDEMVYILEGRPTLVTDRGEVQLGPGICAGFAAGGPAHQLVNRTDEIVTYLEIGDRTAGDGVDYPVDDLAASLGPDGKWAFTHKDGRPY